MKKSPQGFVVEPATHSWLAESPGADSAKPFSAGGKNNLTDEGLKLALASVFCM
jgi:hypothetical protein